MNLSFKLLGNQSKKNIIEYISFAGFVIAVGFKDADIIGGSF